MTEPPLVAHHLGCGDGLMFAGGIVELAKEFGGVRFPVWHGHMPTFREIFKECLKVTLVPVADEHEMFAHQRTMILTGLYKHPYDYWRFGNERKWRDSEPIDQMVYREMGVPLEKKWDSFPWTYPMPTYDSAPYIFVHDDASRGFVIRPDRIGHWEQNQMVCPDREMSSPITSYAPAMLTAEEIHVINSSFLWLADLLPLPQQQRKYFHRYARPWNVCDIPTLRHNWVFLD